MGGFIVFLAALAAATAAADPIVVGSSTFGCETKILAEDPVKPVLTPAEQSPPATCQDLSGTYTGGCYWAVMKCPRVTPLGDCIIPRPDEVYLDNVWTKADLNGEPTEGPKYTLKVTQDACRRLTFEAPAKTFFGERFVMDFENDERGTGFVRFRRSCDIKTPRPMSWERTFDMGLVTKASRRWNATADVAQQDRDYAGTDTNYNAWYRRVQKWRVYRKGDLLRVDLGYWVGNRNYDPKGIEFYSPDWGGLICQWRKQ